MDEKGTTQEGVKHAWRRWVAPVALVAGGALAGGILAGAQVAGAEGTTSTEAPAVTSEMPPAEMAHGPGEELLTGSTASKVEAAALEAVPGGTIIRVETDDEGAAYEAHVQEADGSVVTVKMDEDFTVTETIDGFGSGPAPDGTHDAGA
jgi:uncharacterized membrane protein YkoI